MESFSMHLSTLVPQSLSSLSAISRDDAGLLLNFDKYRSKITQIDFSKNQFNTSELTTSNQQNEMRRVLVHCSGLLHNYYQKIHYLLHLFWNGTKTKKTEELMELNKLIRTVEFARKFQLLFNQPLACYSFSLRHGLI